MLNLEEIQSAQKNLEENVMRKMDELQAQLQTPGSAKDTVAKVADEFRTFRELTYSMFGLLRKQIIECTRCVDIMETRQRRKMILFSGVPESEKEDCTAKILDILHNKMLLHDVTASSIKACHRLGSAGKDQQRPLLVKFSTVGIKAAVWRSKTKLKGSSASVKEFLTRSRQSVFGKARLHFGVRACWTQDAVIVIKASDGRRFKITSIDELTPLLKEYPKTSTESSTKTSTS